MIKEKILLKKDAEMRIKKEFGKKYSREYHHGF